MNNRQIIGAAFVLGFCLTLLSFIGDGSRPDIADRQAAAIAAQQR